MELIDKLILWLDAPKVVGFIFAIGTAGYIVFITRKKHQIFWQAVLGEDGKPQFIEMVQVIWLIIFTSMAIADFTFGLIASDKLWWSMNSIFLISTGAKTATVINRSNNKDAKKPEI